MATDSLGLMLMEEIYFSAAVGTGLALAYGTGSRGSASNNVLTYSSLYLALVIFCVNGVGFALAALTPLVSQYGSVRRFYERHGRRIIIADMQVTMTSLSFLWLAVVGAI